MDSSKPLPYTYLKIRDLAFEDRPRERLIAQGSASLSNAELLAILLGSGTHRMTSIDLAKQLLKAQNHCLDTLAKQSVQELIRYRGIGYAKASTIVGAMALSRRIRSYKASVKPIIRDSRTAYDLLKVHLAHKRIEEAWMILLNRQNKLIRIEQISQGGLAKTTIDPKVVFKIALDYHAHAIILAHNHPSGGKQPSKTDIDLTTNLVRGSRYLHITLFDHLIITSEGYFSFKDDGII